MGWSLPPTTPSSSHCHLRTTPSATAPAQPVPLWAVRSGQFQRWHLPMLFPFLYILILSMLMSTSLPVFTFPPPSNTGFFRAWSPPLYPAQGLKMLGEEKLYLFVLRSQLLRANASFQKGRVFHRPDHTDLAIKLVWIIEKKHWAKFINDKER